MVSPSAQEDGGITGAVISNSQAVAGGLSIYCFSISDFQSGAHIAGTSTTPSNV